MNRQFGEHGRQPGLWCALLSGALISISLGITPQVQAKVSQLSPSAKSEAPSPESEAPSAKSEAPGPESEAPSAKSEAPNAESEEEVAKAKEAQIRWSEGLAAVDRAEYELAVALFRQAYALVPKAKVLRNIGLAEMELGNYVSAATNLMRYLIESDDLTVAERKKIHQDVKDLERRIGTLELEITPDDSVLMVDGERIEPPLRGRSLYVSVGKHHIKLVGANAKSVEQSVELKPGGRHRVDVSLDDAPGPYTGTYPTFDNLGASKSTTYRWPTAKRWAVIGGGVLTAASLGTAIWGALNASTSSSEVDEIRREITTSYGVMAPCSTPEGKEHELCLALRDENEKLDKAERVSTIGWISTGVFGVATISAWLLWPNEEVPGDTSLRAQWSPWVSPDMAGMMMSGQF